MKKFILTAVMMIAVIALVSCAKKPKNGYNCPGIAIASSVPVVEGYYGSVNMYCLQFVPVRLGNGQTVLCASPEEIDRGDSVYVYNGIIVGH